MGTIRIAGSAGEVGKIVGSACRSMIGKHARTANIDLGRVRRFEGILRKVAPAWLEEAAALSEAAGLPVEEILMFNCLPGTPPAPERPRSHEGAGQGMDCTSFLVMNDRSENGTPLLMKIRDQAPRPQIAGIRAVAGTFKHIFGINPGHLGTAHFMNERGLAGANNTGSPLRGSVNDPGLDDCHIARIVAERASDCAEGLAILKELAAAGCVGTAGHLRGMIFLFAGRDGAMTVETSGTAISCRKIDGGALVRTNHFIHEESREWVDAARENTPSAESSRIRFSRGGELLAGCGGRKIGSADLEAFSRDTANAPFSLCNTGARFPYRTLSAFIFETGSGTARISNGPPTLAEYRSLTTRDGMTPAELLTGYTFVG